MLLQLNLNMVTTPDLKPTAAEVVKINQEEVEILLKTNLTLAAKESPLLKIKRKEESKALTNQKPLLQNLAPKEKRSEHIFKVTFKP